MRITPLIMGSVLIFTLIVGLTVGAFNAGEGNQLYEEQAYIQLLSIAESKAERVQDFLDNRKADAVFLTEYRDVKDIFDEELNYDVELMANKIKNIAEKTRDEIKEYLLEHPNMAIEDLQKSEEFQPIAVQRVGNEGYTVVGDYETMTTLFHRLPKQIGFDLTKFKETNPLIWNQMQDMVDYGVGSGFYEFEDTKGVIRNKYRYALKTNITTIDGRKLYVASTSFVDEYTGSIQLTNDLNSELINFQLTKGYSDLIFINSNGDVIWTAEENNELGTNLITGIYNESLLASVFNKAKTDLGVGISDSKQYGEADKLNLFITSPVFNVNNLTGKNELKGVLALQLDNEKIAKLITTDVGLGEKGEVYIINRDNNHISPLNFDKHDSSRSEIISSEHGEEIEKVTSQGIENCFEDYNNYYFRLGGDKTNEVPKASNYDNYVGIPVLGAHQYILESGWCIIVEMDQDEFLRSIPRLNLAIIINIGSSLLILLTISLILDYLFIIKKEVTSK